MVFWRGKPNSSQQDQPDSDKSASEWGAEIGGAEIAGTGDNEKVVSLDEHVTVRDDILTPTPGLSDPEKPTEPTQSNATGASMSAEDAASKGPTMATQSTKPPSPGIVPEIPRRAVDIPGSPIRRPGPPQGGMQVGGPSSRLGGNGEPKMLQVGKDISLSGEITACDTLVVEGTVEAKLENSHRLEIAPTGTFRGPVKIEEAEIAGLFEGDLTVRGTLSIKSSGVVKGTVRFGKLEIELGGVVTGDIGPLEGSENG